MNKKPKSLSFFNNDIEDDLTAERVKFTNAILQTYTYGVQRLEHDLTHLHELKFENSMESSIQYAIFKTFKVNVNGSEKMKSVLKQISLYYRYVFQQIQKRHIDETLKDLIFKLDDFLFYLKLHILQSKTGLQ